MRIIFVICASLWTVRAVPSPITKITTVFDVFNPIALVKFFEFSDKGWNISRNCIRDMYWYLEAIQQDLLWPIKLNDASSHYSGGLYHGNVHRILPRKYCDHLDKETEIFYANFQENFKNISNVVPFRVQSSVAKYYVQIASGGPYNVIQSICFSKSCSDSDMFHIMEYTPLLGWLSDSIKNITLQEVRVLNTDHLGNNVMSSNVFLTMTLTGIFLGIIFHTGMVDLFTKKENDESRKLVASNMVQFFEGVMVFFSSFSPKLIIKQLTGTGKSHHQLHELRVFCIFWITFLQTAKLFSFVTVSGLSKTNPWLFQFLQEGPYSMDLYFYLSGFFLTYHLNCLLKLLTKSHVQPGILHQVLHFCIILGTQLLRIIIPYWIVITLSQILGGLMQDLSVLIIPSQDYITCKESSWRHVLFLDPFSPVSERCVPWTWFIPIEIHYSFILTLIILLTRRTPKFGMIICSSFFISSILLSVFVRSTSPSLDSLETDIRFLNNVYDKPWIYIGPFLIGKYSGELCFHTKCQPSIHGIVKILGWVLILLIILIIISGRIALQFGLAELATGFEGLTHSLFIIIVTWIAVNKISWGWKPVLIRILNASPFGDLNFFVLCIVHIGLVICSFTISVLLFLGFEAPFCVFKRMYIKKILIRNFIQ